MALSPIQNLKFRRNGMLQNTAPVAVSTTVEATTVLVGLNSGGFAGPLDTSTFTEFFGLLSANGRNPLPVTGSATVSPGTAIVVDQGVVLENADVTGAASQGDNGAQVYASAHNALTLTAGSNVLVGFVSNYLSTGKCDVQLRTPAELKALT
jgi:hypothetical protein